MIMIAFAFLELKFIIITQIRKRLEIVQKNKVSNVDT